MLNQKFFNDLTICCMQKIILMKKQEDERKRLGKKYRNIYMKKPSIRKCCGNITIRQFKFSR